MTSKTIIFDLGGVILDLNFAGVVKQFAKLGLPNFDSYFNLDQQGQLFQEQELGHISTEQFCQHIRQLAPEKARPNLTNQQITQAWNTILTPFVPERMQLLGKLAQTHQIFLFSNTNEMHAKFFETACLATMGKPITAYFKQIFYSHQLHQRKPNVSAFQAVIQQAQIDPTDALFIDDNAENIKGAKSAGLKTYHLRAPQTILDLDFTLL